MNSKMRETLKKMIPLLVLAAFAGCGGALSAAEKTGGGNTVAAAPPVSFKEARVMPAPKDPKMWPVWRGWLTRWRQSKRKSLVYDDTYYGRKEFAWVKSSYVCCFAMMCDETFYDPATGEFTVDKFVARGRREFGGYDGVVLWHAYPRIGFDERNQFDFYRDMPGGLDGLRDLSRSLHKKGIKVFINYNPWDRGTRREGKSDLDMLVEIVKAIEADGIFLDTLKKGGAEFRRRMDAARAGVVLESELELALGSVASHHMSWAQWFKDAEIPGVLRNKWFERRHMLHQISRWHKSHTVELQMAWMNGSGMMVWENVFGSWMGWNPRDRSTLRSMTPIQRRYVDLFAGEGWAPLVQTKATSVYASLWEGGGRRLWTLVNRAEKAYDGDLLAMGHKKGDRYYDLVRGQEAQVQIAGGLALVKGKLPARGIGALLAAGEKAVTKELAVFLKKQAAIHKRRDWSADFPARKEVLKAAGRTKQYAKGALPKGMVAIDGGTIEINVRFRKRECGMYQTPLQRKVKQSAYGIDLAPVTNKRYAEFLKASGYKPRFGTNFLKHWVNGKPPAGKEDHPVVYVDLGDARAYAKWAGKRLPTEDEWQYAAQGTDGRIFPWGDRWDKSKANVRSSGTKTVGSYPEGASPFGALDMAGNVSEMTDSYEEDLWHRFMILRGGSWFQSFGSIWYVQNGIVANHQRVKYWMINPGFNRSSTIGFRCIKVID